MRRERKFGICICGLNGSGKTTIGRELSEKLGFFFMDVENYYFTSDDFTYSAPCTREEVEAAICSDVLRHPCFVLSGVKGDYGREIESRYDLVVYLDVPREMRLSRVRARSRARFGRRMEPGGDVYEREKAFLGMVATRTPALVESWLATLSCPILRLDGRAPICDNVLRICEYVERIDKEC